MINLPFGDGFYQPFMVIFLSLSLSLSLSPSIAILILELFIIGFTTLFLCIFCLRVISNSMLRHLPPARKQWVKKKLSNWSAQVGTVIINHSTVLKFEGPRVACFQTQIAIVQAGPLDIALWTLEQNNSFPSWNCIVDHFCGSRVDNFQINCYGQKLRYASNLRLGINRSCALWCEMRRHSMLSCPIWIWHVKSTLKNQNHPRNRYRYVINPVQNDGKWRTIETFFGPPNTSPNHNQKSSEHSQKTWNACPLEKKSSHNHVASHTIPVISSIISNVGEL